MIFYCRSGSVCQVSTKCTNLVQYSCSTCGMKICLACWRTHRCEDKRFTKVCYDHKADCFQPWCDEHQSYANFICFDCDERFVCTYCVHRGHKHHKHETIDNYAPQTRKWLMSQINVAKDFIPTRKVSYHEEFQKIELFRKKLAVELRARKQNHLRKCFDELSRNEEVLLNQFDNAFLVYKT